MNKWIYVALLNIAIYLYIHNPFIKALGGFGSIAYLFPLLVMYIGSRKTRELFRQNRDLVWISCVIVCFCGIRFFLGGDFDSFKYSVYHLLTVDILAIPLVVLIIQSGEKLDVLLLENCLIAVIITIFCLVNPSFDLAVKNALVEKSEIVDSGLISYRGFGFAGGLIYNYGVALGIILSYLFYKGYLNKWWFPFLVLFTCLAILVNARTGFIIAAFSFLLYMIFNLRKKGFYLILGTLLVVAIIPVINLNFLDDKTLFFIEEFFGVITTIFESGELGENNAVYDLSRAVYFPDTLSAWVYGYGINIFTGSKVHSDIGFVQQLFYGGLIYILLLFTKIVKLLKRVHDKYWLSVCLGIFIIANIKGDFIGISGAFRLFYLIIIYEYWKNRRYGTTFKH